MESEEKQDVLSSPVGKSKSTNPILLAVVAVAVAALIATGMWKYSTSFRPAFDQQTMERAAGFLPPVSHMLDARFSDVEGNLVADAPTDPSKFIDPPTLNFSYVASETAEQSKKNWQGFCDYLSKATGKPVEYLVITDPGAQLKAFDDGKLQVAGFNTGSVPSAVNHGGFIPVCAIPTTDGSCLTHTDIIVPPDSQLQKPEDLKGHELTLTVPESNSGCKAPLVLLRANFGLHPVTDFNLRYSQSHEISIAGVANHKYEAAAVASDMLGRQLAAGAVKSDQYHIIYESESFPTAGLGYAYNLKPELAKKIRDALLNYDWKGTPLEKQLNSDKQTKFVPVNYKNDWALIRRIDDEMGEPVAK